MGVTPLDGRVLVIERCLGRRVSKFFQAGLRGIRQGKGIGPLGRLCLILPPALLGILSQDLCSLLHLAP